MKSEQLDEILDEVEKKKLEQLVGDEVTMRALKKVLLYGIYGQGTLMKGKDVSFKPYENFALVFPSVFPQAKDEEVGANLKACWQGINLLITAFQDLERYGPIPVQGVKNNPAR